MVAAYGYQHVPAPAVIHVRCSAKGNQLLNLHGIYATCQSNLQAVSCEPGELQDKVQSKPGGILVSRILPCHGTAE